MVIVFGPILESSPPPTLYLTYSVLLVGGISPNDELFIVLPILSICPLQPINSFNSVISDSPPPNVILVNPLSVYSFINL